MLASRSLSHADSLVVCAKLGGAPTAAAVELWTQNAYFGFQVVQVFLVTTFASAATSVVTKIIQSPTQAPELLANNLPNASNFYISYIILQGLTFASGALLAIAGLIIGKVLGKFLDGSPRKMYNRWSSLAGLGWGTVLPPMSLLAVIGTSKVPELEMDVPNLIFSYHILVHRSISPRLCHHRSVPVLFRIPLQLAVRVEFVR